MALPKNLEPNSESTFNTQSWETNLRIKKIIGLPGTLHKLYIDTVPPPIRTTIHYGYPALFGIAMTALILAVGTPDVEQTKPKVETPSSPTIDPWANCNLFVAGDPMKDECLRRQALHK